MSSTWTSARSCETVAAPLHSATLRQRKALHIRYVSAYSCTPARCPGKGLRTIAGANVYRFVRSMDVRCRFGCPARHEYTEHVTLREVVA